MEEVEDADGGGAGRGALRIELAVDEAYLGEMRARYGRGAGEV